MAFGIHQHSRRGNARRAPMADINVTPLVDVMLVLLIVFMVTAPLLAAGVPVELPDSRAKPLTEEQKQITLSLTREGKLYLDNAEVPSGGLADRLAAFKPNAQGKMPLVTLRADKSILYGQIMGVMGELNRAGFNSISLVTSASQVEPPLTSGSASHE